MVEIFSASPRTSDGSINAFEYDEIIEQSDITSFEQVTHRGQGERRVFDRREGNFVFRDVHLFDVEFTDSSNPIEYQVSTELSLEEAQEAVDKYGKMYGRLPAFARETVDNFVIFPGDQDWGGNQSDSSVQVSTDNYSNDRSSEDEILLHEAAHAISSDPENPIWESWEQAIADDGFRYLNEYSTTLRSDLHIEDFSENLVMWYGIRTGEITDTEAEDIENFVTNRFQLLDELYGDRIGDIASNSVTDSFQSSAISNGNPTEEDLVSPPAASPYNAFIDGTEGDDDILGTAISERIEAGLGNDVIVGAAGDDTLIGGAGADILTGGEGSDTFYLAVGERDTIADFELGSDRLSLGAGLTFDELNFSDNDIQLGDSVLATLTNVETTDLNTNDFTVL